MDRMLSLLGLCARAGKLITGEKACVQAIRSESVFAALLDGAASDNAVKAVGQACAWAAAAAARPSERAAMSFRMSVVSL